jgi:hypothetical protein
LRIDSASITAAAWSVPMPDAARVAVVAGEVEIAMGETRHHFGKAEKESSRVQ